MSGQKRKDIMNSNRQMFGVADLTGQTIAGLEIQTMVARRPEPRYQTRCTRCGTIQTESQHDLTRGASRCRNTGCARQGLHEEANLTLAQFQRREAQKEQAKIDAIKGDFEHTARKVAEAERKSLLHLRDDAFRLDPDVATIAEDMTEFERDVFTERESAAFLADNPDYLPTPANGQAMSNYLSRNDAARFGVLTSATLTAAYRRLDKYGLLERRPKQEPTPHSIHGDAHAQAGPLLPVTFEGWDITTGEPRTYSEREVNRMSSNEMKRALRLYSSKLALPNVGPGSRRPR